MAYSRFFDSDLYIYSHVEGYVCCSACWLSEEANSEIIKDDNHLFLHLEDHSKAGHNMPEMLYYEIIMDEYRYLPIDMPLS
jgi:hypothetical protein